MKLRLEQALFLIVFAVWLLVRIFPLAAYPGLYSYDAWNHLGYLMGIAQDNRIPAVNPLAFPYYQHPALHLFALVFHHFLGLPLLESLKAVCLAIPVAAFFSFYILLRAFLKEEWQVLLGMLILSVSPDLIAQTNAAIPESLALIFYCLSLFAVARLINEPQQRFPKLCLVCASTVLLFLSHHLASLLFIISCLAIILGVLLSYPRSFWRRGLLAAGVPAAFVLFLFTFSPWVFNILTRYAPLLLAFFLGFTIVAVTVAAAGSKLLELLERMTRKVRPWTAALLGIGVATLLLAITTLFYPIPRTIAWRVLRFSPIAILLGFSAMVLPRALNARQGRSFLGASAMTWILTLAVTFTGSTVLAFAQPSWGDPSIMLSLAHRQFTYLTLVASIFVSAGVAAFVLPKALGLRVRGANLAKTGALAALSLLGVSLIAGSVNLYFPAGGWNQTWFSGSEISAAYWLGQHRVAPSTTVTDQRVMQMFEGVEPFPPSSHRYLLLNSSHLANPAQLTGTGGGYFYVSDLVEQQFMIDFATPPTPFPCRPALNTSPTVSRIYASLTVTLYHIEMKSGS